MTKIDKFFANLNKKMEMVHHDPYKWLHDIEVEDIPEVIDELEEEIDKLENSKREYDGAFDGYPMFIKRVEKTIEYKRECIKILQNTWNDNEEGEEE